MIFRETTYSVLIVSSSEKFNASLASLLSLTDYYPVHYAKTAAEARQYTLAGEYDLVFINSPLLDEFGNRFAADICKQTSASVLLFVRAENYTEICAKVTGKGVMVLTKPLSSQLIVQALQLMCAGRERLRKVEEKQATVEEKIKEIRVINHAKSLLIECLSMTEEDAYKYIEKQAMDMRLTKREVAENIIKTYR